MPKISIANQFQRSIRIDLDLDNMQALSGYITVPSCINMLCTMRRAIMEKHEYAFTWTGAYGSGKSSLALMMLALMSPNARVKKMASSVLKLKKNDGVGTYNFSGQYQRLCLVGGRKSLRADVCRSLYALSKTEVPSDLENVETKDLYDRLDSITANIPIFLVIDELGKYLEYAIKTNDVYFLQELADYASRSEGRLIVLGILHQSFDAYVSFLPLKVREEWAKVQGRFENYLIEPSPYESLKLIAGSIVKEEYDISKYEALNDELADYLFASNPVFKDGFRLLLRKCLPLHGITAVLLASLARKNYGQNERTIYSFLNSMEPFSLNDFIEHSTDSAPLYRPCELYDYLRINQDININLSRDSHKWAIAKELIERLEYKVGALSLQLLKTIAVIDIFSAIFRISASQELLRMCLNCTEKNFESAMQELKNFNAVLFRNVDRAYHLFIGSDFDFSAQLNKELLKTDFDVNVLNRLSFDKDRVIARRHYLNTGNLRWMKMRLVMVDDLLRYLDGLKPEAENFAEFTLVLFTNENQLNEIRKVAQSCSSKAILGYALNSEEIVAKTREYSAIGAMRLYELLEGDDIARSEVVMRQHDTEVQLRGMLEDLTVKACWIVNGKEQQLNGRQLSALASDLADSVFCKSLSINNELINRSKISPNITAFRRALLVKMINNCDKPNLGINGTPADFSMFDTLLRASGIYAKAKRGWAIDYHLTKDHVWHDFFVDTEKFTDKQGIVTLDQLYAFWHDAPYGIKDGVMPVLALIFILSNIDRYAFYDDQFFITDIDDTIVDDILVNHDVFTIKSYRSKRNYVPLSRNISRAINQALGVHVSNSPLKIARTLVKFIYSLPSLSRNTNSISNEAKLLRVKLKVADDPIALLYKDLPEIFHDLSDNPDSLTAALVELKEYTAKQFARVKEKLLNAFDERYGLPHLAERATVVTSNNPNRKLYNFKQLLDSYKDKEQEFLTRFIVMCSEVSEERWGDSAIEKTLYDLPKLSLEFRQAECFANVDGDSKARRMVALTFASGVHQDTSFVVEISPDDENIIKENTDFILYKLQKLKREQAIAVLAELGRKLASLQ